MTGSILARTLAVSVRRVVVTLPFAGAACLTAIISGTANAQDAFRDTGAALILLDTHANIVVDLPDSTLRNRRKHRRTGEPQHGNAEYTTRNESRCRGFRERIRATYLNRSPSSDRR